VGKGNPGIKVPEGNEKVTKPKQETMRGKTQTNLRYERHPNTVILLNEIAPEVRSGHRADSPAKLSPERVGTCDEQF